MISAPGTCEPKQRDAPSSASSSTLAPTPASRRALKRQRTPTTAATPLHPPPTPEVVILRLIELPKLLVVRIVHLLEFSELASLDTSCAAFHPETTATEGLTQLSAEMRAQWVLKPWQVSTVLRPAGMGWARWLVDVRWRERVVRASGGWLSCGGLGTTQQHMLVASKEGAVMSQGYDTRDVLVGTCPFLGHGNRPKIQCCTLKVIDSLKAETVVQVAVGSDQSLVLTESGNIFSFGGAEQGKLGHGDKAYRDLPTLVEALNGTNAAQVSAGAHHNLVMTASGDVFTFGWGCLGQLGHGDAEDQHLPKLVAALKGEKVVQVSAGGGHSLVLTASGDVFSFGFGGGGMLGHGDRKDQHLPKLVVALQGKKVVQVAAGSNHSLVLTESNDVFSFGQGEDGRLGHGDEEELRVPKRVEALKGERVVQVDAGEQHSLALTENGDVFSFGAGKNGKLGHGDEDKQCMPKLVEALKGKRVVEVQAGTEQSMVLTRDGCILVSGLNFAGTKNLEGDEGLAHGVVGGGPWPVEGYDVPEFTDEVRGRAFGLQLTRPPSTEDK